MTEIRTVGVVGAGVMGSGIAQAIAVGGAGVLLYDVSSEKLAAATELIQAGRFGLNRAVERGKISAEDAAAAVARVNCVTSLEDLAEVDLVVEAVPENLELKLKVFRELDRILKPGAILASNSSGFPIAAMAGVTDRPELVIGWHWASPAQIMRLAEIVRAPSTSDDTVAAVVAIATAAGKRPIVVKDAPMAWGYVANRIYAAMYREAERVVSEGIAEPEQVGRTPDGLLRLADRPVWHEPRSVVGLVLTRSARWSVVELRLIGRA